MVEVSIKLNPRSLPIPWPTGCLQFSRILGSIHGNYRSSSRLSNWAYIPRCVTASNLNLSG